MQQEQHAVLSVKTVRLNVIQIHLKPVFPVPGPTQPAIPHKMRRSNVNQEVSAIIHATAAIVLKVEIVSREIQIPTRTTVEAAGINAVRLINPMPQVLPVPQGHAKQRHAVEITVHPMVHAFQRV